MPHPRTLPDAPADTPRRKTIKTPLKPKAKAKNKPKPAPRLKPTQVLAWLQRHPAFFTQQAATLQSLMLPNKSGNVLSLHGLKAERLTKRQSKLEIRQQQLISTAKANQQAAEALFALVRALLPSRTVADLRYNLTQHAPTLLEVGAVRLFSLAKSENDADTATTLTAATLANLCPTPVVLGPRDATTHRPLLGAKTADYGSLALLHLADHTGTPQGLLVLASAAPTRFHAGQDTLFAAFLGHTIGQLLANLNPTP
jgi:uncharacterized protein